MLIKTSIILGKPIFTIDNGKKVEDVDDVLYNPHLNKIEGLLVDKGGLFSEAKVILFDDIRSLGEDAVLIDSPHVLKKASDTEKSIETLAKSETYLTNTKIITEEGTELGKISDIYFDNKTGAVEEFEVSQGAVKNIQSGKKRVKVSDIVTVGEDATIVKIYVEKKLKEQAQTQGVQGTFNKSSQVIDENITNLREKTQDISEKTRVQLADAKQRISEKAQESQRDIESTQKTITSEETKERAKDTVQQVKETIIGKVDEAKVRRMEKRKKDAVGMYLTKNILTSDDTILAKEGDMVTNKLLQDAEENGIVDQVLDNLTHGVMAIGES